MNKNLKLTGTARYASINALSGFEQSRRDDLESFGYVLAYLIKGGLPWMGLHAKNKEDKYSKILKLKKTIDTDILLKNGPQELIDYINYCKKMEYEQEPDYNHLINLFKNIIIYNLNDKIDYKYDWVTEDEAKTHMKLLGQNIESSINSNIVTTREDTDMNTNNNTININNQKNNIDTIEKNDIDKTKEEKIDYYDEVIDEIILLKNKENDKDKDKKKDEEDEDKNKNNNKKEKKHGQCCIII